MCIQNFIIFFYCILISTEDQVNGKSSGGSRGSSGGSRGSGSSGDSGGSSGYISPTPGRPWGSGGGSGSPGSSGSSGYGYGNRYYYPYAPSYYWYYHGAHSGGGGETFAEPELPAATQPDKDDAAEIVNKHFDEKVIASILPFRTLDHRKVINNEIANLNKGHPLIHPKYLPTHKNNPPFKDMCFSLLNYPIKVLAMYLGEFLHHKDETYIIMVLTLCQQMELLTDTYNQYHKNSLRKRRIKQRHPFANLMKVWVERDRDPDDSKFTDTDTNNDADILKKEYPHWDDKRDSLENVLIRKSMNYSLAVIQKFEADVKPIEEAIKDKIKNHDLVDAYTSLALYVKNTYNYMAKTLLEHCDSTYGWAIWIMYVGIVDPKDWPAIDTEFKKINNNVSLKDHILSNSEPDKILLQVMAVMIDPTYKPNYL